MKRVLALTISLIFTLTVFADEKKTITPEDIVGLHIIQDVQISPDGKRVLCVVGTGNGFGGLSDTHIYIVPTDGSEQPRVFTASAEGESSPRWSPDGKSIAFLSKRKRPDTQENAAPDMNQVWVMRVDGGEAEPLTNLKTGVDSFKWSPDGKMIAFLATDAMTEAEEKKQKEKDDAVFQDHNYKFSRLYVLDLPDRKVQLVFKPDLDIHDFIWSADGSEFAINVSKTPLLDDIFWHSKLEIISRTTGEIVRMIGEPAGSTNMRWSPDGQTIAFGKISPSGLSEWHLMMPAKGGIAKQFDDDYNGTVWAVDFMPDSKSLIAETFEGTRAKFISVDVASGARKQLGELNASYGDFTISKDGSMIAVQGEQPDSPPNVWIIRKGEVPHRITNFQPEIASWNVGAVREITWKNKKDGKLIYGLLITPPDFQQGKKYPTIVQVHGGPEWAWWTGWHGSWHEWGQLLASNGYAVLLANPRGSDGQGWRFIESNINDWGGMDFEDIMSGVDDLIAQGIADPERLGIGGWSYGGFMSGWAVTHSNRFKAAVVGAGGTDLLSFTTSDISPSFLNYYFQGLPYTRWDVYADHSPVKFLQNCKTPSLILHGEADTRVPPSQGWEFYNGLKMLGVPTEMVTYPREPHGLHERLHQRDLLTRILAWYDRYLKNQQN